MLASIGENVPLIVTNPQHVDASRVRHLAVQFDANLAPAFFSL
jgi:hypothetical protein